MRVIPPIEVTEVTLTSSTCAEPHAAETEYDALDIYAMGDQVISTTTHRTYESLSGTAATVTMTIATPCVVSWAEHGLAANTPIAFTTTGALPTGLTAGTVYYVLNPAADTFQVAVTAGGAAIDTSGTQSGTHTATANPNKGRSLDDPLWWSDVGPTRRWAMFDLLRSTGTSDEGPLTVIITPGERVDSIALVGMVADEVTITVEAGDPLAEVYSYTANLVSREVTNWYEYFFEPFSFQPSVVLFDLPAYLSGVITVTLTRSSGDVTCGALVIGRSVHMGYAERDAVSDTLNFSKIERDEFGTATLIPRRNVPQASLTLWSAKANVNRLRAVRDVLNAAPALWSGLDDDSTDGYFEAVLILGIYKRFAINLTYPQEAKISLELEEI